MVELRNNRVVFSFPEVHRDAVLDIEFQRTLRIPDDGEDHFLPPGLGRFPLRHVDDLATHVSAAWLRRGGVMLPMYQSEAMWLNFRSATGYPFAVKVGTGRINAITGEAWSNELTREPQDYLAIPRQPWLDGYCVGKGIVRQFVAMPLGSGYTAEEQLDGSAEYGGVQLLVHPLKAQAWRGTSRVRSPAAPLYSSVCCEPMADMGLAPGGRMRQEIFDDEHHFADWEFAHRARCFVHIANSLVWRAITGEDAPGVPPTAVEYTRAGLPWFDDYAEDRAALAGGDRLKQLRSVMEIGRQKGDVPLPENESVASENVVRLRAGLRRDEIRQGSF